MKKNNVIVFGIVAILFAGIGLVFSMQHAPPAGLPAAAESLLSQTLTDADGKTQSLAQWRGKPLVVNFWATWCAPCVEEMPELTALQSEIAQRGIQIIGIGIDSPVKIAEFSKKHQIGYPLYAAGLEGSELSRQFGNHAGALPYTVVLNKEGKVVKTYLGRLKMDSLRRDLHKM